MNNGEKKKEHQKLNVVSVSMVVSRGHRQKIGDPEPPFNFILVEEVWGREELIKLI